MKPEKIVQIVAGQAVRTAGGTPETVAVLYALTNEGRVLVADQTGPHRDKPFVEIAQTAYYDLPEKKLSETDPMWLYGLGGIEIGTT
jgi:hypothetical protein